MRKTYQDRSLWVGFSFLLLCGCSIWESYPNPDYSASRADRVCHPLGDCSQGEWVSKDGLGLDAAQVQWQCVQQVNKSHGNGWWKDSVTNGLEIKQCMEKKGYVLRQL